MRLKLKKRKRRQRKRKQQKGKGIFSNAARGIQNYFSAWHKAYQ